MATASSRSASSWSGASSRRRRRVCPPRRAYPPRRVSPPPRLRSSRGCMHDICARVAPPLPPFSPPLTRSMFAIFLSFFLPLLSTPAGRRAAMSPSTTRATRAQRTRSSKARETASCERSKMGRRQLSRVVAEKISAEARGTSRARACELFCARVRAVTLRTCASCGAARARERRAARICERRNALQLGRLAPTKRRNGCATTGRWGGEGWRRAARFAMALRQGESAGVGLCMTAQETQKFRRLNETFYVGSCGFRSVSLI